MGDETGEASSEPGMRLTYAGPFDHQGFGRLPARCHIRIWRARGSLPVVIATELLDNPGTSITNAAELVTAQVWERLLPDAREGFVWIERYPAGRRAARGATPGSVLDDETLDLVTFVLGEKRDGVQQLEMDRSAHPWKRISRPDVERMVGLLPMVPEEV